MRDEPLTEFEVHSVLLAYAVGKVLTLDAAAMLGIEPVHLVQKTNAMLAMAQKLHDQRTNKEPSDDKPPASSGAVESIRDDLRATPTPDTGTRPFVGKHCQCDPAGVCYCDNGWNDRLLRDAEFGEGYDY